MSELASLASLPEAFGPLRETLAGAAAAQPQLVTTLAKQLLAAVGAAPGHPEVAVVDVSSASVAVPGITFLAPKGRCTLHLTATHLVLVDAKGAQSVAAPLQSFESLVLLTQGPAPAAGAPPPPPLLLITCRPGADVAAGRQRLAALLLSPPASGELSLAWRPAAAAAAAFPPPPPPPPLPAAAALAAALCAAVGAPPPRPAAGFSSARGGRAFVDATLKVTVGRLFPTRTGLAFLPASLCAQGGGGGGKPLWLPCARWDGVSVGRAGGGSHGASTFDLVVSDHSFGMIARDELPGLQAYVAAATASLARGVANKAAAAAAAAAGQPGAGGAGGAAACAAAAPAAAAGGGGGPSDDDDDDDEEDEDFAPSGGDGDGDGGTSSSEEGAEGEEGGGAGAGAPGCGSGGGRAAGGGKRGRENAAPGGSDSDDGDGDAGRWGVKAAA